MVSDDVASSEAEDAQQPQIRGEPLDEDVLLDFATIDGDDVESAIDWFDTHASAQWRGALDNEPEGSQ